MRFSSCLRTTFLQCFKLTNVFNDGAIFWCLRMEVIYGGYTSKNKPLTNDKWNLKNRNKKIGWLCLLGRNSHILNSSPSMLPCCHWPSSWMEFYLTLPRHRGTVSRSNKSVGPTKKTSVFLFFSTLGSPFISGSVEVRIRNLLKLISSEENYASFFGSPTTWSRIFSAGSPCLFVWEVPTVDSKSKYSNHASCGWCSYQQFIGNIHFPQQFKSSPLKKSWLEWQPSFCKGIF